MQFADDIAFLAQWQEGVEYVTAVTLQEMANGLVIRIASNHTPTDKTVRELKGTMALVSEYASKGTFLLKCKKHFRVADLRRKTTG